MSKLPHIVRATLAASHIGNVGSDHPDADLLSAFAERQLAGPERERVLAHLGTCATCREVVALASPEELALQPLMTTQRSWWAVRSYQYGLAAAAMALVAVGLVMLRPDTTRDVQLAKQAPLQRTAETDRASTSSGAASEPAATPLRDADAKTKAHQYAALEAAPRKKADGARPEYGFAAGAVTVQKPTAQPPKELDRLAEARDERKLQTAQAETSADTLARSDRETAPVTAADLPPVSQSENGTTPSAPAANATTEAKSRIAIPGPRATRADLDKDAQGPSAAQTTEVTAAAPVAAKSQPGNAGEARLTPAANRPAKTALAGALLKTEEEKQKALARDPNYNARTVIWRINAGRLQRFDASRKAYDDVAVSGTSRLSVVGSLGTEVWVGGTDGALSYSNDQGAHWIPVSTGAWSKEATFVGLTPTALRSVEVHLSNGERWRSADGGASWSKYE